MSVDADVVIVGGGIAGLACGVALADAGLRPLLLEEDGQLGGRARSWADQTTGDRVDIGPHILLSEYRNMLDLLGQLGSQDHICWLRDKFITLVDEPGPAQVKMHHLPAPIHFLPSMLRLPQISVRDLLSNSRLIWRSLRLRETDVLELDREDAETVLRRLGVSERFIDWFWRSAAMSIMNVPLERCSAGALLSFFRYMIGRSNYQVGFAAQGLGDLFAPPAVRRIEKAGGRVLMNTQVSQILGEDGAVSGLRLRDGTSIATRQCVAALPPKALQVLLPPAWIKSYELFRALSEFQESPYLSTYLWFDRKLTSEKFWARVWSPANVGYDFYDLSNIREGWSARPSVIACNSVYSEEVGKLSDEEVTTALVRELAEFAPAAAQARVRHARVHRIPMAIPAPYPGSEQRRPSTVTPVRGLFFAGDWIKTGLPASMESAVRAGRLAAEAVLAARGTRRTIALPLPKMTGFARLLGKNEG